MSSIARSGNVRSIRPGLLIPEPSQEDERNAMLARLAASYERTAYQLAQTEPNSREHLLALHMAGIANKLPRNNLRLLVTPLTPRQEWFSEAWQRWRVASAAKDLAWSEESLARSLDEKDGGERAKAAERETERREAELRLALEDALRTPTARKADAVRKQTMIGKREWAEKYRPEWQAMVDEDLARYPQVKRCQKEAQA